MTVALAAVAAVLLVAALGLAVTARRTGSALRASEQRAGELSGQLRDAVASLESVEQQKRAAEVRATSAEGRLRGAEQKAGDAERRAGEAERRVGEEMRRAEEAERAAAESGAARVVWELERLRVEREWLDVVGPGVPLPVPWDGSVAAVVATELSVIREVIGTPSVLAVDGTGAQMSPGRAGVAARVSVEMLRTLARSGEEMEVRVSAEAVTVAQPVFPGEAPPDLSVLAAVATAAGMELTVEVSEDRAVARLALG